VQVKDTGVGIKAEELRRIFTKFAQANATTTRNYGGSGLGLAITKRSVLSLVVIVPLVVIVSSIVVHY